MIERSGRTKIHPLPSLWGIWWDNVSACSAEWFHL